MADINAQDIRAGKEQALKTATGIENLDLSNLTDDELDSLFGQVTNLEEKVDGIIDSMDVINAPEIDYEEAIRVHTGVSLKEAKIIYKSKLQERSKPKTDVDRLFEMI